MAHTTTREQKTRMLCTAGLMAVLRVGGTAKG